MFLWQASHIDIEDTLLKEHPICGFVFIYEQPQVGLLPEYETHVVESLACSYFARLHLSYEISSW